MAMKKTMKAAKKKKEYTMVDTRGLTDVFTERSNDVYSKGWPPGTWAKWRPSRVNAGGRWHAVKGPMEAMKAIKAMKAMKTMKTMKTMKRPSAMR